MELHPLMSHVDKCSIITCESPNAAKPDFVYSPCDINRFLTLLRVTFTEARNGASEANKSALEARLCPPAWLNISRCSPVDVIPPPRVFNVKWREIKSTLTKRCSPVDVILPPQVFSNKAEIRGLTLCSTERNMISGVKKKDPRIGQQRYEGREKGGGHARRVCPQSGQKK